MTVKNVSVVGLGKVGSPMVASFASRGFRAIGVDLDAEKVRLINQHRAPVVEPGLQEMITAHGERISATLDYAEAVSNSDITFIIVPTPSREDGGFSSKYAVEACTKIGHALRNKSGFHLVVLASTVLPGTTGSDIEPTLERSSGKRCGVDFGLCYSPRFIALGSVIRDLMSPDLVLVGESDPTSGQMLEAFNRRFVTNNAPIVRMNYVNAELAKIAVNTYVTTKITFANMLSSMCERLPGANVDVVTSALGLDTRIGAKYLRGAVGYGGPCFPRDNLALSCLGRQLGVPATIAESTDALNRAQVTRIVKLVKATLPPGGKVGILGLAYKTQTDVTEESQGVELARQLSSDGVPVVVYDPMAMESARRVLKGSVRFASSVTDCAKEADALVLVTPWDEFKGLQPKDLAREGSRPTLLDCWRMLDPAKFADVADYVALGVGPSR